MFCLLINFANSLEQDLDRQNVGPDLDSNSVFKLFDSLILILQEIFEKVDFEKISADDQMHATTPSRQRVSTPSPLTILNEVDMRIYLPEKVIATFMGR